MGPSGRPLVKLCAHGSLTGRSKPLIGASRFLKTWPLEGDPLNGTRITLHGWTLNMGGQNFKPDSTNPLK